MSRRRRRNLKIRKVRVYKTRKKGIRRTKNKNIYKAWRAAVFGRDNFTCQRCQGKGKLNAHHIRPWALFANYRYVVSNGVTLCEVCHKWVHEPGRQSEFLILGPYAGNS